MKRFTKLTALMLVVVMVFAGCGQAEYNTKINSDGSATVVQTITLEKTVADTYVKKNVDGYNDFESYIKDMQVLLKMSGETVNYEKVTKDDGKEYYIVSSSEKAGSKNLSKSLTNSLGLGEVYATKDTVYAVVSVDDTMTNEEIAEIYGVSVDELKSFSITYSFEFPAEVSSTTGKIDSANKKSVTFNLPLNKATTIFATTNKSNTLAKTKAKVKKLNTVKKTAIKSLKVKSVKKKKGTVTLKLKKVPGVKYYIEYSTNKKFPYSKTNVKSTKKTTVTIKNLKAGKKYYFRVKAYKNNYAGLEIYSKAVKKSIKIPKK